MTTKTALFSARDRDRRPPASVEKLFTTVALASMLSGSTQLQTTVLGVGHFGPHGIWHGKLYLRGGGDPTFGDAIFNRTWELGYGTTGNQLVQQLTARGIRKLTGAVIGDASLFDSHPGVPSSGFAPDVSDLGGELSALTYDHGATSGSLTPGAFAAKELVLVMRSAHISAHAARATAVTPVNAVQLASVSSPPLSVLLKLMNVPSDDLFAELLTKQLGVRFGGAGSTAAGARVIASVIGSYGVHPKIVDGSGLSRLDRASPLEVVDLLRSVWRAPAGDALWDSLPVVGASGTVRQIATGTAAQGHCVAKTGTLDGVTNLAGYCHSAGHHVLAFGLLIDGPSNGAAIPLLGRMVAAIARY